MSTNNLVGLFTGGYKRNKWKREAEIKSIDHASVQWIVSV